VRIYSAADEEALRTRRLLIDWTREGLLTEPQLGPMERDAPCELRRTNAPLRLTLFFFASLSVAAAIWLFFLVFFSGHFTLSGRNQGILLLVFGAMVYAAAEFTAARAPFYRHGIEEAFAFCSVVLLCLGLQGAVFDQLNQPLGAAQSLLTVAGAIASFLIYRRFGYQYALAAAMVFAAFVPQHWTGSDTLQRLTIAAVYGAGLIATVIARRAHRFDYLGEEYATSEALLWLGLYLTVNLRLSSLAALREWFGDAASPATPTLNFPAAFYWTTYAAIWLLPAAVLRRGLLRKDRLTVGLGVILALLTIITNKPYLGLPRHTWDPMLLGVLLIGLAAGLRRWLDAGPDGVRNGFTARRLSARDRDLTNALPVLSMMVTPTPSATEPPTHFGGGSTGGGGASSDF